MHLLFLAAKQRGATKKSFYVFPQCRSTFMFMLTDSGSGRRGEEEEEEDALSGV
jgi:hypothetical protein